MNEFRIVEYSAPSGETEFDESSVIWRGEDPKEYAGGYGTFDEGDRHIKISFQVQHSGGSWVDLKGDPRKEDAVGALKPSTAVIVDLEEIDSVKWVAGQFQISAEGVKSWRPNLSTAMTAVTHMLKHDVREIEVRDLSRYDRRFKITEL